MIIKQSVIKSKHGIVHLNIHNLLHIIYSTCGIVPSMVVNHVAKLHFFLFMQTNIYQRQTYPFRK